jgi:hypothetical protein
MVTRNETPYTWEVDLGRKIIRNDPGGSFRSRLGSPDIKKYKRTNAGVEAHIIDFGLSYWSRRMPNPETADGGYEGAGIYGHGQGPGTIYYDIHRFLYTIYVKVRQPENAKERAIKNFIEELIPNKEFLEFNGKFTSQGYLLSDYHVALRANLPTFKTILTHPFLTGEKSPNRPKTLSEALKMLPKAKTPPKVKTPKETRVLPPRNYGKLSAASRKKAMNNMIKKAAAILAANKAKPKTKPAPRRRPGVVRPNPVPEIQPASPEAPYAVMSPSNMMEYAAKIESGRKKAANKLNARIQAIKATKGKTPTPVRLKEKFSFVNVKGKKREFVRKFAYDRALAKNKAEREKTTPKAKTPTPEAKKNEYWRSFVDVNGKKQEFESKSAYHEAKQKNLKAYGAKMQAKINRQIQLGRDTRFSFVDVNGKKREYVRKGMYEKALAKNKAERSLRAKIREAWGGKAKTVTPKAKTVTPKAKWSNANNKQFMELLAREKNAQRKLANKMNKARPLKNGPSNPAVAYALNTPKNTKNINKYVNGLSNNERNMLKKKICKP